ncbi:Cytochrome c oxidase copper chaperone [Dimargaris cristalligena]|uniref:Mitochondrial cytochrome c oxidase assembly protein/Cu2+ chaperone COX17 n=1 Tax=Dimargaris cristalligena TaxID=215637 RepID=A0A4Q0A1J9_9FUNG|nr:Cytochrome c oxidase copper chaperone [Dimargaris cristalligena]RKP39924.1 mitochondrial cytochrome c oxidase assembly protein/Cu2+ chaperone COX17 [Dimargaris cristalligena]|eukprot:RKP39924.1 mitochondrial cytochrome c oxidase assembly protein/Cu2+ chaperone COX17 [Dimargaris cristalligena]
MGASQSKSTTPATPLATPSVVSPSTEPKPDGPPAGLKPCCACPETKKARDECVLMKGEENCQDLIEKHKQCLRDLGFKI